MNFLKFYYLSHFYAFDFSLELSITNTPLHLQPFQLAIYSNFIPLYIYLDSMIELYPCFVISVIKFFQPKPNKPDSAVFFFKKLYDFYEKRQKLSEVASIFLLRFEYCQTSMVWSIVYHMI